MPTSTRVRKIIILLTIIRVQLWVKKSHFPDPKNTQYSFTHLKEKPLSCSYSSIAHSLNNSALELFSEF